MASLDKAFIKAYRQQESAVGAIPIDTSGTDTLVDALEDRPLREAKKRSAAARHDGVLAALQSERLQVQARRPAATQLSQPAGRSSEQDAVLESDNQPVPPFLHSRPAGPCHSAAAGTRPDLGSHADPGQIARGDGAVRPAVEQVIPPPHIGLSALGNVGSTGQAALASETAATVVDGGRSDSDVAVAGKPGASHLEAAKTDVPSWHSSPERTLAADPPGAAAHDGASGQRNPAPRCQKRLSRSLPPGGESGAAGETETVDECDPEARTFHPLLQVDRISPSSVGRRLQQRAAAELDRLADALLAIAQQGRQVIGFASDKAGQGTTTLLGAVALRLAARRVPVATIDACMADPQLATELGLLPEYGWEEALAGSMPWDELVIESASQPMALMPLCRPFDAASLPDDFTPFREALATLREHYDLVLVDLGAPADALIGRMLKTLDTVLLVHNVRSTRAERVSDLHRTLSRAGVSVAGIIESFVPGG